MPTSLSFNAKCMRNYLKSMRKTKVCESYTLVLSLRRLLLHLYDFGYRGNTPIVKSE